MNIAIRNPHRARAFTLVEVMVVVAILALLAAIAIPNYQRARKRGQAAVILNDLRVIDGALDRWAVETKKKSGDLATFDDIKPYLKTGTPIYETGRDVLGNEFGPDFTVDLAPEVPAASYAALLEVAPATFWSPYRVP